VKIFEGDAGDFDVFFGVLGCVDFFDFDWRGLDSLILSKNGFYLGSPNSRNKIHFSYGFLYSPFSSDVLNRSP
jgi:hypothetical protein